MLTPKIPALIRALALLLLRAILRALLQQLKDCIPRWSRSKLRISKLLHRRGRTFWEV